MVKTVDRPASSVASSDAELSSGAISRNSRFGQLVFPWGHRPVDFGGLLDKYDTNPEQVRNALSSVGFEVLGVLGKGARATVYVGIASNGELRALKLFHNIGADQEKALSIRKRAEVEMDLALSVKHSGTIRALDVMHFSFDERPLTLLVLEACTKRRVQMDNEVRFIRSPTLDETFNGPPLSDMVLAGRISNTFLPLCNAVQAIHAAEILHGDLSSKNVVITSSNGAPKVIDFGEAKRLANIEAEFSKEAPPFFAGTLSYSAPDSLRYDADKYLAMSDDLRRTALLARDIYSLASILYLCTTGTAPCNHLRPANFAHMLANLLTKEVRMPERPTGLSVSCYETASKIILSATHTDPLMRPSLETLISDLTDML